MGTASYRNSYTVDKDSNGKIKGYNVTSIIKTGRLKLTYKYYITASGIIKFDFTNNNYWSVLWRGAAYTLAKAMYKQAKAINKKFLYGRSVGGIHTELEGHWAVYTVTKIENARVADMGALIKGKTGYDSNAWVWEAGNAAKIVGGICAANVWGSATAIKTLVRYVI